MIAVNAIVVLTIIVVSHAVAQRDATASRELPDSVRVGIPDSTNNTRKKPTDLQILENASSLDRSSERATQKTDGIQTKTNIDKLQADSVLLEIRDHLRALKKGNLSEDIKVERLFTVPLTNTEKIQRELVRLREENALLISAIKRIEQRLSEPQKEIPEPLRPSMLDKPPVAPQQPFVPDHPEEPTFAKPRGKPHAKRSEKWLQRYQAWEQYEAELAAYKVALEEADKRNQAFTGQMAAYNEQQEVYQQTLATYTEAKLEHKKEISELVGRLGSEAANMKIRLEITEHRISYLTSLVSLLKDMPASALETLADLDADRVPLRDRAEALRGLNQAIKQLSNRLRLLRARVVAGSLLGFQVEREKLAADINKALFALTNRARTINTLTSELIELTNEIEQEGSRVKNRILSLVMHPKRQKRIDEMFIARLNEMRHNAKAIRLLTTTTISEQNVKKLKSTLDRLITNPKQIGSTADGKRHLDELKAHIELLDAEIGTSYSNRDRYRQAFRREVVTVLSNMASAKTKSRAYSLSSGVLSELGADLEGLRSTLQNWGEKKWSEILDSSSYLQSQSGLIWITRLFLAIVILLMLVILGRRIDRLVARGIRRLSGSPLFRNRVGTLVRWAGLFETVFPIVLFTAASYAALALIGFEKNEIRFIEVAVRWSVVYLLGRRLLEGLTRRVSFGRPAFISLTSATGVLLSKTYSRLGMVLTMVIVIHHWTLEWIGTGLLSTLIIWFAWCWVAIWSLGAMFAWRQTLGEALSFRSGENGAKYRLGKWMVEHTYGVVLSPFAAGWIVSAWLLDGVKALLAGGGFLAYIRARSLRRKSRQAEKEKKSSSITELPKAYLKEFPLYPIYGEEDVVLLPRESQVQTVLEQIERWRTTKQDVSLVVIGEKGIGKTTFLSLLENRIDKLPVKRYSLTRKLKDEKGLASELSTAFGIDQATSIGVIASQLNSGDERVVLLDEAHNVFLRTVDGYHAYEALVRLVNFTSDKIFWLLVFNTFAWAFINQSRKRIHYFRKLMFLPSWSQDEIQDLIVRRNRKSGFEVVFDEVLLDQDRSRSGDFEVIDSADGYFRLLWEASGGNPRVATHLWTNSLKPTGDGKLKVGLFIEKNLEEQIDMDREILFTLAAFCQHENLSVAELQEVLNTPLDFAAFAVRYLSEYNIIEPKHTDPKRNTLAPNFYTQVIKVLKKNHLIFE